MYTPKKTDYQRGYEEGEELVATHVNKDGKPKAKEYIGKLADKNKGKTDALNYFIDNSASYFVPPQFLGENNIYNKPKPNKMKRVSLNESQLRNIIKEAVNQLLEYNDDWLKRVGDCGFLSDEDKKKIQIASMNNWDRHEREEKKKQDMDKLSSLANKNVYDKRMVGESVGNGNDIMDAVIMIKEAYYDIKEFTEQNKSAGLDLAEAMGNLRGAVKILGYFA